MNIDWNQSGMPMPLVNRLGRRNEFAEFKSVLNDAGNQVLTPVDAESMARELVESGGREFVEVVRELTAALTNAKRELEDANRRCDRLTAELARRGLVLGEEDAPGLAAARTAGSASADRQEGAAGAVREPRDEWAEWDRKFQSLLG